MTRIAVLTGGSRGIGAAILVRLLANGYDCHVIGLTPPSDTQAHFIPADLADHAQVVAAADYVRELGASDQPISLLINNAGGALPAPLVAVTPADVLRDVTLNLNAPIMLTSAAIASMTSAKTGTVINIASTAGRTGVAYLHAYSAAKAGLIAFSQSAAAEHAPHGIQVICLCPGSVDTATAHAGRIALSRLHGLDPAEYEQEMASRNGMGRLIDPGEIADVVQWLVTSTNPALAGQTLNLCGTLTMG
jgi:NAD(P)-dependent dehydrogenase (short-subunit alcohol dehydrogenase family)